MLRRVPLTSRSELKVGFLDAPMILAWLDVPGVRVPLAGEPLDLALTLDCGQAFRWSRAAQPNAWVGVLDDRACRLDLVDDVLTARLWPAPGEIAGARL